MKKILCALLLAGYGVFGQGTLLFHENFNLPSGGDSIGPIYSTLYNPGQPVPTQLWNDTSFAYLNHERLFHAKAFLFNEIIFETPSFSTIGFPYVNLEFDHIAKLYPANFGKIEISLDGGASWTTITSNYYKGNSSLFNSMNYFNEHSYFPFLDLWQSYQNVNPAPSWWQHEKFELRGLAYDTVNNTGYANVKLRFNLRGQINPAGGQAHAGWFIDNLKVLGANCEMNPPVIIPGPIYPGECSFQLEGNVVPRSSNVYYLSIKAQDAHSGMDSLTISYSVDNQPYQHKKMSFSQFYYIYINGLMPGSTVKYYFTAVDNCGNQSRYPQGGQEISFYLNPQYPGKCSSLCEHNVVISNFPWQEDFESALWIAGNNGNIGAGLDRGTFPIQNNWTVAPPTTAINNNKFGWCVGNGPTHTTNTGPLTNHTPGGSKYLFTEGSNTSYTPGSTYSVS